MFMLMLEKELQLNNMHPTINVIRDNPDFHFIENILYKDTESCKNKNESKDYVKEIIEKEEDLQDEESEDELEIKEIKEIKPEKNKKIEKQLQDDEVSILSATLDSIPKGESPVQSNLVQLLEKNSLLAPINTMLKPQALEPSPFSPNKSKDFLASATSYHGEKKPLVDRHDLEHIPSPTHQTRQPSPSLLQALNQTDPTASNVTPNLQDESPLQSDTQLTSINTKVNDASPLRSESQFTSTHSQVDDNTSVNTEKPLSMHDACSESAEKILDASSVNTEKPLVLHDASSGYALDKSSVNTEKPSSLRDALSETYSLLEDSLDNEKLLSSPESQGIEKSLYPPVESLHFAENHELKVSTTPNEKPMSPIQDTSFRKSFSFTESPKGSALQSLYPPQTYKKTTLDRQRTASIRSDTSEDDIPISILLEKKSTQSTILKQDPEQPMYEKDLPDIPKPIFYDSEGSPISFISLSQDEKQVVTVIFDKQVQASLDDPMD